LIHDSSKFVTLKLPSIYPITDRTLSGLSHAEQVKRLIDGGATLIQLREKHASPHEFYSDAMAALQMARRHKVKLIINDRVDIALATEADGVHLGQTDMPVEAARRLLGDQAIIGYSTHNAEQALAAIDLPVDYIAFGPVYDTSTKDEPDPVVGLAGLRRCREIIGRRQLVAIGGLNFTNASEAFKAGADSAAVIKAILHESDQIAQNIGKLLDLRQER
jgi:thiamine-phosphate pyrophosphorylase